MSESSIVKVLPRSYGGKLLLDGRWLESIGGANKNLHEAMHQAWDWKLEDWGDGGC